MKQTLVRFAVVASLALTSFAFAPSQPAVAFTGHGCKITTCRYFTSSYAGTKYFYDRTTCGQWKTLSRTYLQGFKTKTALKSAYPTRRLHAPC
jgi:hypothetical protein